MDVYLIFNRVLWLVTDALLIDTGLGFTVAALFTAVFDVTLILPLFTSTFLFIAVVAFTFRGEMVAPFSREVVVVNLLLRGVIRAKEAVLADAVAFGAACMATAAV